MRSRDETMANVTHRREAGRMWIGLVALLGVVASPAAGAERVGPPGKVDPDGYTMEDVRLMLPEYFSDNSVADIPDIYGPGKVLTVGNVFQKVTNVGHVGNFFTNLSSDPGGQWPGASGIEYLSTIRLYVGAKNPTALDPAQLRRVSYLFEWRPPTLNPVDRIYEGYDGVTNGQRYVNDDGDVDQDGNPRIDEDFLNGKDDDGDGRIDEDFGAIGQQMFSWEERDDTPQAINATFNEKHVPLGLLCRHLGFAFSVPGFNDFNAFEYYVKNVSGHVLDSVFVGFLVDMDAGPIAKGNWFADDFDLPYFPQDSFYVQVAQDDPKYQGPPLWPHSVRGFPADSALCPVEPVVVQGFSIGDDDGDDGQTPGMPSVLLLNHTIDPLGIKAPRFKGWHMFRSFTAGTPYQNGGNPIVDQQRYELLSATATGNPPSNVDPATGFVTAQRSDQKGDQVQIVSVGPFLNMQPNEEVNVTIAFMVSTGSIGPSDLYTKKPAAERRQPPFPPSVENALSAQIAYNGIWELRSGFPVTDYHGRETKLQVPRGVFMTQHDCRDDAGGGQARVVAQAPDYTWFDFDCNYCTGVWTSQNGGQGFFHKVWNASAPPPSPNLNVSTKYNYTANPGRQVVPGGNHEITLAWDNLSETTPDPKTREFDFYAYKIWRAANWTRPVGSAGPGENDWSLLGEYVRFAPSDTNITRNCPTLYVPNYWAKTALPPDYRRDTTVTICLNRGDLIDFQSGYVIRPDASLDCLRDAAGNCQRTVGIKHGTAGTSFQVFELPIKYPVGRYVYRDTLVQNGFLYFYSVTAKDSNDIGICDPRHCLEGRRSAVESEAVTPQTGTGGKNGVWVVPNPYRAHAQWDLTPNATDPTGTHIDFMGMPSGTWTLKIFTVAGDLVQTIRSTDPVNESLRASVTDPNTGVSRPGTNLQQDSPNDGQARWNLITRSGQDVVSGIYLFTVESKSAGHQIGRFVIIR